MGQLKSLLDEMQTNLVLGLKKATGTDAGILLKAIRVTEVPDIQSADLAMSLEVREHLPPSMGHNLVVSLVRSAPLTIFTAATPGQGGSGHVNEQPSEYWIEEFAGLGRYLDVAATTELRSRCRPEVKGSPWLAANAYSRVVRPSEQSHQCR